MTRGLTPPSVIDEISALKKRVTDLERKLDAAARSRPYLGEPFSLAGPIYTSESPPWKVPVDVRISALVVLLGTPGTTTTTVALNINGTQTISTSLAAGEVSTTLGTSILVSADLDTVTISCTAAGDGAEDLVAILRIL